MLTGFALRVMLALRPGLWGDEIFSLAMATGHSLEHPAAEAQPSLGDFVEPREAQPPSVFRRYAQHEQPAADVERVVRAVRLSDTSPPLYYILLNWWTRAFGTGDAALRLFSVWWAVLSLPLLWCLGRELGGSKAAWSAALLFCFSPLAIYYSTDGRMYSLLWFLATALAWLTLHLAGDRRPESRQVLWVLVSVAGLYTHYFFAFVWLACAAWLAACGPPRRWSWAALAGVTLVAVLPWYLEVPSNLARWRVTTGWLDGELSWPGALASPVRLAFGLLAAGTPFGRWHWANYLTGALLLPAAVWIVRAGRSRWMFSGRRLMLWGWLAAACAGPIVIDLLRHTTTTKIPRYVLPALPAALLLASLVMSQLPSRVHLAVLGVVLAGWMPGIRTFVSYTLRPWKPYVVESGLSARRPPRPLPTAGEATDFRKLAVQLEPRLGSGDVVLIQSIPSGVVGLARYLTSETSLASWVVPLGTRELPGDLDRLLAGRRRVALVKVHGLGAAAPAEAWLLAHARLLRHELFPAFTEVLYFAPSDSDVFYPAAHEAASQSRDLLMDIADMKSEVNTVLHPRMTSVAPNGTHSGRGSGSRSDRSHSSTSAPRIAEPAAISPAPISNPVSSVKRR
jgi:hypothetical protein